MLFKSFSLSFSLWSFFFLSFLMPYCSSVCSLQSLQVFVGSNIFEPLNTESVKERMLTVGSHFPEKYMYQRKCKLLLLFFLQCCSVYKTNTHSLFLFPSLNSLCSKIFIMLFLISILGQEFDQTFWSKCLDAAGFPSIPECICFFILSCRQL